MNQETKIALIKEVNDYVEMATRDCSNSEFDELQENALSDLGSNFDAIDAERYICTVRPDEQVEWLIQKQYIINNLL